MNITKHNPSYKLISVTINDKEFVYSQHNNGTRSGLEVYYLNPDKSHYYSRRYNDNAIPMLYRELAINLSRLLPYCAKGHKLTLEGNDYNELLTILKAA